MTSLIALTFPPYSQEGYREHDDEEGRHLHLVCHGSRRSQAPSHATVHLLCGLATLLFALVGLFARPKHILHGHSEKGFV